MPVYNYKIITPERAITEGKLYSWSAWWVKTKLRWQKNIVLVVQRDVKDATEIKKTHFVSMSGMQRILFFRNMAMMLDSGITISDALKNNAEQAKGLGVKTALHNVYLDISNGVPLSVGLSRYPQLFPAHIIKTIEVGEQSGTLSPTLDRISLDLERTYELRRKVIGAISYPAIIIFFMLLTAILLIVMVLPQIIKLFADMEAELPAATRFLESVNVFITTYPLQIGLGILISILLFMVSMRSRRVRIVVHGSMLRTPILGNLMREYSLSVFTRALGTLLSSGITFVQALETVKGTVRNESYIYHIEQMYPVVLHGGLFSDALRQAPFHFPDQFRHLIEVGEQSGKLRVSFEKASEHYERSVLFQTQMLTTIIEPLLMLIAGLLVGFLAFSIFSPLYGIATQM